MADLAAIPWPDAAADARRPPVARRRSAGRGPSFWIAVGVVLTFSQGWVMILTGPNGDPASSGAVRALFFPAYGLAAGLLLMDLRASARAALATPLLWLLMAIVCASVMWSVDPDITQRRAIALVFTTLAGVALAARFGWADLAEVFAFTFAALILGSLFTGLFLPGWGRMSELFPGAWRGLWNEKNALGDHMAQGFAVLSAAAILNPARRRRWAAFAGLALVLILLSTSKTSLVTFGLGVATLVLIALARRGGAVAVAATLLALAVTAALAGAVVFAADKLFLLLGKDPTLTGRTTIWDAVMRRIDQRPLLGWGYVAVWDDEDRWAPLAKIVKEAKFRPHHAHNSWIETRLDLGLVGLGAWIAYYGETAVRALVAIYRSPGAWLAAPFLVVYTFQSLTETMAFIYNDFVWVLFTAVATRLALGRRGEGATAAP